MFLEYSRLNQNQNFKIYMINIFTLSFLPSFLLRNPYSSWLVTEVIFSEVIFREIWLISFFKEVLQVNLSKLPLLVLLIGGIGLSVSRCISVASYIAIIPWASRCLCAELQSMPMFLVLCGEGYSYNKMQCIAGPGQRPHFWWRVVILLRWAILLPWAILCQVTSIFL